MQTIWPALRNRLQPFDIRFARARWNTPDADFLDVDWLCNDSPRHHPDRATRPLLVLFHGLEGSSQSHYARAFAQSAGQAGWAYAVPHFRGCSGEINYAPRAYHSGDYAEIDWIMQRLRGEHAGPVVAVGVSLGGNALLRWAQEAGASASQWVRAIVSICSPIDLNACGQALGIGLNRVIYTPMFLQTMKPKALHKLAQYPGLFDEEALLRARTLYDFDNIFTAPLHGFKDAADYWQRASAKPHLHAIKIPTLLIQAKNDPFVPAHSQANLREISQDVTLWQPEHGGHVGFMAGHPPGHLRSLPQAVTGWLKHHLME